MNKSTALWLLGCLLITKIGYCELNVVKSNLNNGYTVAIPVHSNGSMKAYVAADTLDLAICWTSYPKDGRFYMRMYYECQDKQCLDLLIKSFEEGVASGETRRWSNVEAKYLSYFATDTIFDLPNRKQSTKAEWFMDKWGYLLGQTEFNPAITEELDEKRPFSFEVATRLNNILTLKLQEARENPHSCINIGTGYMNSPPRK